MSPVSSARTQLVVRALVLALAGWLAPAGDVLAQLGEPSTKAAPLTPGWRGAALDPAVFAIPEDLSGLPPLVVEPADRTDAFGNPLSRPGGSRLLYYATAVAHRWYVREEDATGGLIAEFRLDGPFGPATGDPPGPPVAPVAPVAPTAPVAPDEPGPLAAADEDRPFVLAGSILSGGTKYGSVGLAIADLDGDGTHEVVEAQPERWIAHVAWNGRPEPVGPGELGHAVDKISVMHVVPGAPGQPARVVTAQGSRLLLSRGGHPPVPIWEIPLPGAGWRALHSADLDRDGSLEIVAGRYGKICRYDLSTGADEGCASPLPSAYIDSFAAGDVDGDGSLELVVGTYDGTGAVLDGGTLGVERSLSDARFVAVADVDGDGRAEIVLAGSSSWAPVKVQRGDGTSVWSASGSRRARAVALADVNSNGRPDVAWIEEQWGALRVADGATGAVLATIQNPAYDATRLAAGDLDGDAVPEFVWGSAHSFTGAPDALLLAQVRFGTASSGPLTSGTPVWTTGDTDGDGSLDIVVAWYTSMSRWEVEVRDGRTRLPKGPALPVVLDQEFTARAIALADVDGDGAAEVVLGGSTTAGGMVVLVSLADGLERWRVGPAGYEGAPFRAVLMHDVTGDGRPEIIAGASNDGITPTGTFAHAFAAADGRRLWSSPHLGRDATSTITRLAALGQRRTAALATSATSVGTDYGALSVLDEAGNVLFTRLDVRGSSLSVVNDGPGGAEELLVLVDGTSSVRRLAWVDTVTGVTRVVQEAPAGGTTRNVVALAARSAAVEDLRGTSQDRIRLSIVERGGARRIAPRALELATTASPTLLAARDLDGDQRHDLLAGAFGGLLVLGVDPCPYDRDPDALDGDGDGWGDACDLCAARPDVDAPSDADGDGRGDACDEDDDADGLPDEADNCPDVVAPSADDADLDGRGDACDVCPLVADPAQVDTDRDGQGDACDDDDDGDGVRDAEDACPAVAGSHALDTDLDGRPDLCDDDDDADGRPDAADNCALVPNPGQERTLWDGPGDACSSDWDRDGRANHDDLCPRLFDADPLADADADRDGTGDACDPDPDGDGRPRQRDVCALAYDPGQADTDDDGTGDACDPTPAGEVLQPTVLYPGYRANTAHALAGADFDGDGRDEWFSNGSYSDVWTLIGLDPATAAPNFRRSGMPDALVRSAASGDADGDGRPEVWYVTDTAIVRLDPTTGREYARAAWSGGGGVPWLGDVDGDGRLELLAGGGGVLHAFDAASLARLWQGTTGVSSAVTAGDLDADGTLEIVLDNGRVLDGRTRQTKFVIPTSGGPALRFAGWFDADGDGDQEIAIADAYAVGPWDAQRRGYVWVRPASYWSGRFIPLRSEDTGQTLLWTSFGSRLEGVDPRTGRTVRRSSLECGTGFPLDIDGDGRTELVSGSSACDPWGDRLVFQYSGGYTAKNAFTFVDADADGSLDVVYATGGRALTWFSPDGVAERGERVLLPQGAVSQQAEGADLDLDGTLDLVTTSGSSMQAWRLPGFVPLWTRQTQAVFSSSGADRGQGVAVLTRANPWGEPTTYLVDALTGKIWFEATGAGFLSPRGGAAAPVDLALATATGLALRDSVSGEGLGSLTFGQAVPYGVVASGRGPEGRELLVGTTDGRILRLAADTLAFRAAVEPGPGVIRVLGPAPGAGEVVAFRGPVAGRPQQLLWLEPRQLETTWSGPVREDSADVVFGRRGDGGRMVLLRSPGRAQLYLVDGCRDLAGIQTADGDGDGAADPCDVCPGVADPDQRDTDRDRSGDACDDDLDGDGVPNHADVCVAVGDPAQRDGDGDGAGDACDVCPERPDPAQVDTDRDGAGDACDDDDDGDGRDDTDDLCPRLANADAGDLDGDGTGDACDADGDGDGLPNAADSCPAAFDPSDTDTDMDTRGDACDPDGDADGVPSAQDNCPLTYSASSSQLDTDGDGRGDVCDDDDDADGVPDVADLCPRIADAAPSDRDGDGIGDACDAEPLGPALRPESLRMLFDGRMAPLRHPDGTTDVVIVSNYGWEVVRAGAGHAAPRVLTSSFARFAAALPHGVYAGGGADVDRDGTSEVLVCGAGGTAAIHVGQERILAQAPTTCSSPGGSVETADLDRDGTEEVLVEDGNRLVVLDVRTLARRKVYGATSYSLGDIDGDGRREIVLGLQRSFDPPAFSIVDARTGRERTSGILQGFGWPVFADGDGDGRDEVYGIWSGALARWRPGTRSVDTLTPAGTTVQQVFPGGPDPATGRPTVLARVGTEVRTYALDGTLLGVSAQPLTLSSWSTSSALVADVDGDGTAELLQGEPAAITGWPVGPVRWALDPVTPVQGLSLAALRRPGERPLALAFSKGYERTRYELEDAPGQGAASADATLGDYYPTVLALGDRDGDGSADVAQRSSSGGSGFNVLAETLPGRLVATGSSPLPATALAWFDLDGDGADELAVGTLPSRIIDGRDLGATRLTLPDPPGEYNPPVGFAPWPARGVPNRLLSWNTSRVRLHELPSGALLASATTAAGRSGVGWFDYDQDGTMEVYVAGDSFTSVRVLRGDTLALVTTITTPGYNSAIAAVPERGELLLGNNSDSLTLLNPRLGSSTSLTVPWRRGPIVVEDLDGDRHAEIVTFGLAGRVRATFTRTVHPPSAAFGPAEPVACAGPLTPVTLDGTASSDADSTPGTRDDIAAYHWSRKEGGTWTRLGDGETRVATLPVGATDVLLETVDTGFESAFAQRPVRVVDAVPPAGRITSPRAGACVGPAAVPVVVADDFVDLCDPAPPARTYTPQGPVVDGHGDHDIRLDVRDASGNASVAAVAFTIDLRAPRASIRRPAAGQLLLNGSLPLATVLASDDDDGAAGDPVRERLYLDDCLVLDGALIGDGDGRLVDETVTLDLPLLCRAAAACGRRVFRDPRLRFAVEDCGGNPGTDVVPLRGTLALTPDACGR